MFLTQSHLNENENKNPRRAAQMTISFYKIPQHLSLSLVYFTTNDCVLGDEKRIEMNGERDCIDASRRRASPTTPVFPIKKWGKKKKKWKISNQDWFSNPLNQRPPGNWTAPNNLANFFFLGGGVFNFFLHEIVRRKKISSNYFEVITKILITQPNHTLDSNVVAIRNDL